MTPQPSDATNQADATPTPSSQAQTAARQVLVTGGTGFVGSHVVRLLAEAGYHVRVLHRTSSKLTALNGLTYESAIGDVTDLDALRRACEGCDWVFHVAAVADYWRADVSHMMHVNIEGTRRVLQAAREAGVQRVVFTSSAAAVGLRDDKPADESEAFNLPPQHFPYGYSKSLAEALVAEAVADGQDVVMCNPVVVIGPGDLNMISGSFIVQTYQYQWLTPGTSGGVALIDVRDVAAAHIAAAEKGRTGERYILNAANIPYSDFFAMIAAVVGVARPIVMTPDILLPPVAGTIDLLRRVGIKTPIDANQVRLGGRKVYFDGSKAASELHTPQVDIQQSIADTFAWYQAEGYIQATTFSRMIGRLGRMMGLR